MLGATRLALIAPLLLGGLACGGEESHPPAPSSPTPRDRDGGGGGTGGRSPVIPPVRPMPDEDAGAVSDSGVLASECKDVPAVPFIGEDTVDGNYVNAIELPTDLSATRVVGTWSRDCDPPTIVIELSDGECPDGDDHRLRFEIDAPAIASGVVKSGINAVTADGEGPIRVRYERPASLPATGLFGNCAGSEGNVNIPGEITLGPMSILQAQFELTLTPCDDGPHPPREILGTFHVELERELDDVCR